jgi:hypothetical protein
VSLVGAAFMTISGANLAPSKFEGDDGDLAVGIAGNLDWVNAPARTSGLELGSGSTDNGFGQGTKEDDPAVKVGQGSIPKNKSDLTRFYAASDFVGGDNYLYLAWERANVLGSANMDFEINQNTTVGISSTFTGPMTLNRTAGDLLVTFDFSGSGAPTLGLLRWTTTGSASQCFSASALPCWGNRLNLSAAGYAEGAVNSTDVSDSMLAASPRTLPTGTFGEAAINLTDAGVFPAGGCTTFGSAFLKSRSSTSFTSEVKDFVAPQSVHVSNCGTISITKVTENGNGTFNFGTSGGLTPVVFDLTGGQTQDFLNVPSGDYTVTESGIPAGWNLVGLSCDQVTGTGTSASTSLDDATASITIAGGGTVACIFTNRIRLNPRLSTTQSFLPNDQATISGATSDATGSLTFELFGPGDAICAGTPEFTQTIDVHGNGNYPTTNSTVMASTPGTWRWKVAYSGDAANVGTTSACGVEHFTITNG